MTPEQRCLLLEQASKDVDELMGATVDLPLTDAPPLATAARAMGSRKRAREEPPSPTAAAEAEVLQSWKRVKRAVAALEKAECMEEQAQARLGKMGTARWDSSSA